MASALSIMVLPTGSADALPQFLLDVGGVWRDLSPSPQVRALTSITQLRSQTDVLLAEMSRQMLNNPQVSWARLRSSLREIYRALLPDSLHQALQKAVEEADANGQIPRLRIHQPAAAEWIPWEILEDGQDFLGLRFALARMPVMPSGPNLNDDNPRRVKRVFNLLGEHAFDDVLEAQLTQDWATTFAGLPVGVIEEQRFPGQNGAGALLPANGYPNVDNFLIAAAQGDILHVTCHGDFYPNDSQLFWTLSRYSPVTFAFHITATILKDLSLSHAPLIFGNACFSSGANQAAIGLAPGFGSIFFARGALAFLGSFAAISQSMAVKFACEFYRRLLPAGGQAGPAVGEALLETKRWFRTQKDPDPSYLYYALYGPPETHFLAG